MDFDNSIFRLQIEVFDNIFVTLNFGIFRNYFEFRKTLGQQQMVEFFKKFDILFGYIEYFEDEDDLRPTIVQDDEILLTAKIAKGAIIAMSVITIGIAIVQYIFGSKILKDVKKNIASKKHIITLLVFSILSNSTLTMAFMIVALCIKDKKVTLENINEIASQSGEQITLDQLENTEQNNTDKE